MDATEHEAPIVKNSPKIPGYTILSRLGEGGMATVYLAIQESFGRKVAIKVMMPKSQDDPSYGERFLREAKIVARLSHPHIVPVYDVGSSGDYYYISMEYLDDGNLADRIRKGLTIRDIIRVTRDVALALDYAHRKGIIHRDIKPDNIMFREDGAAVLTDFGIARPTEPDSNMTQVGKVIGTPKYMSPEQTKGEALDNTCDLYALGIMLYEMLTGNVPFDGANPFEIGIKHLKDPVPRLPSTLSMFQPLIDKLLVKNKEQRLQSGQEAIAILTKIEEVVRLKESLARSTKKSAPNDKTVVREATPASRTSIHADASDRNAVVQPNPPAPRQRFSASLTLLLLILMGLSAFAVVWTAPRIAPGNTLLMNANHQLMKTILPETTIPEPIASVATVEPPPVTPVAPPATTSATIEKSSIQKHLDEARVAVALGNYATPEGDSALDHYRNALAMDAENLDAKLGIADIASKLITQTNEAIESGNMEKAHGLIEKTRSISENIPGLANAEALLAKKEQEKIEAAQKELLARQKADAEKKRQEKLAREQEVAARIKTASRPATKPAEKPEAAPSANTNALFNKVRINGLLAKADTYYTRGEYYGQNTENALRKYQEALSLDPGNVQARKGIEKIITIMLKDIRDKLDNQEPGTAQMLYKQAIQASPDNIALQTLARSRGW